jgi:hypothetical protein
MNGHGKLSISCRLTARAARYICRARPMGREARVADWYATQGPSTSLGMTLKKMTLKNLSSRAEHSVSEASGMRSRGTLRFLEALCSFPEVDGITLDDVVLHGSGGLFKHEYAPRVKTPWGIFRLFLKAAPSKPVLSPCHRHLTSVCTRGHGGDFARLLRSGGCAVGGRG